MINSLRVRNYRKHQEFETDFDSGLNLLVGDNFAGKSTLLNAIRYALGGARAVPGKAEDLTCWTGAGDLEVRLTFDINGDSYVITRTLRNARLERPGDDKPRATGHAPVTAEVEALLGRTMKDFRAFQVTAQGDAADLLEAGSTVLAGYVATVTGMDVIDRGVLWLATKTTESAGALAVLPDLEEGIGVQEAAVLGLSEELKEAYLTARAAEVAEQVGAEKLREQIETRDELAKAFTAAEQTRAAVDLGRHTVAALEDEIRRTLDAMPGPAPYSSEHVQQQLNSLLGQQAEADEHARSLASLEAVTASAKGTCDTLKAELDALTEQMKKTRAPAAIESQIKGSDQVWADACSELKVATAEAEGAVCPACNRPFEGRDPAVLEKAKEDAATRVGTLSDRRYKLRMELATSRDLAAGVAGKVEALAQWEDYRGACQAKLDQARTEVVAPPDPVVLAYWKDLVVPTAAAERTLAVTAGQLQQREQDLARARKRLAQAEAALIPGPELVEVDNWSSMVSIHQQQQTDRQRRRAEAQQAEALLNHQLTAAKDLLEGMRVNQARRIKIEARHRGLKELTKFLRDNRDRYTESFWSALLEHASLFVAEALPGEGITIGRNAEGDFVYVEAGQEKLVAGNASGYQAAVFSLAVKLALADALGGEFSTLLLDEVTAAARDERSLDLVRALAGQDRQVLLVSHRGADSSVACNIIEVG